MIRYIGYSFEVISSKSDKQCKCNVYIYTSESSLSLTIIEVSDSRG